MSRVKFRQLSPGVIYTITSPDIIYTMTTDAYINALISGELDGASFKPLNHYKRRVVPFYWYEKLFFWEWFKKEDLVDIKFVGGLKEDSK